MKRNTPSHPKLFALAEALEIPIYSAVGLLELMWHFAAKFALPGDIGRHPDDAIAKALCWDGASTVLVSALVRTGWLDACPCHRLRIHDWPSHADQTVQRVLTKRNQVFLKCYDDASMVLGSCYDETSQPKACSLEPKANCHKPEAASRIPPPISARVPSNHQFGPSPPSGPVVATGAAAVTMSQELSRVEAALKALRGQVGKDAMGNEIWSEAQKTERARLKQRQRELRVSLGLPATV